MRNTCVARAACVRRLPSLASNSLTRTVCEHSWWVRVTPLLLLGNLLTALNATRLAKPRMTKVSAVTRTGVTLALEHM
jgi:hypothetical protein